MPEGKCKGFLYPDNLFQTDIYWHELNESIQRNLLLYMIEL